MILVGNMPLFDITFISSQNNTLGLYLGSRG